MPGINRRSFIATTTTLPLLASIAQTSRADASSVRFGIISDVHHGMRDDVPSRLATFLAEMKDASVDFIIQLGDFCHSDGSEESASFLDQWNAFPGPKYHVLGNHDMDKNSKETACETWGMQAPYYSFEMPLFTGVVLDPNFYTKDGRLTSYDTANWYGAGADGVGYLPAEQTEWLTDLAASSSKPLLLFSHYGFDHAWGVYNRREVRRHIEDLNQAHETNRIAACFCGHYHLDGVNTIEQVHYIRMNSASYHWLGQWEGEKWTWYTDPLFAIVEITADGVMTIEGRASNFEGAHPFDEGFPREPDRNISARISDRNLIL